MDLETVPAPSFLSTWWPIIAFCVTILLNAVGGVWAYWYTMRVKKVDSELQDKAEKTQQQFNRQQLEADAKLQLQLKQMEQNHDQHKIYQETLLTECRELRDECRKQREDMKSMHTLIAERDATILERDKTISKLNIRVSDLEYQLSSIKAHVAGLEEALAKLQTQNNQGTDNANT